MFIKLLLFVFLALIMGDTSFAAEPGTGAPGVVCDIISLLTGRIFRAFALLIGLALPLGAVITGNIDFKAFAIFAVGTFIILGAGQVALFLLPSVVTNVSGTIGSTGFSSSKKYTPEQIIKAACPNLRLASD
jgi:hypothetical protein